MNAVINPSFAPSKNESYIETFFIVVSFFMVLYRKDKRGLHDMISGTKVIDLKIINSSNVIEAEIVKEIEQKEKDKVDEEQERLRARFK